MLQNHHKLTRVDLRTIEANSRLRSFINDSFRKLSEDTNRDFRIAIAKTNVRHDSYLRSKSHNWRLVIGEKS